MLRTLRHTEAGSAASVSACCARAGRGWPDRFAPLLRAGMRAIVFGLGVIASSSAVAAPSDEDVLLGIEWHAEPAAACDRGPELRALVQRLAGPALEVRAEVEVSVEGLVLQAVVRVYDGTHVDERRLASPRCESLVQGAALVLAVSADAVQTAMQLQIREPTVPEPPPPTTPLPAAAQAVVPTKAVTTPSPPSSPLVEPEPSARRRLRLGNPLGTVDVRGHGGVGVVPGISAGVGGGLTLGREHLIGRLGATYWAPSQASQSGRNDVGVEISAWTVDPQVCGALGHRAWRFLGCAGAELGQLTGRGNGRSLTVSRTEARLWAAAATTAIARFEVHHRFLVGVWTTVNIPVTRARFVLSDGRELFATSAVGLRGGLELVVRFW